MDVGSRAPSLQLGNPPVHTVRSPLQLGSIGRSAGSAPRPSRRTPDHYRSPIQGAAPRYLAHLCELIAWSLGSGLLVCWLLTGFAILTGAVMIQMEDAELQKRFGEQFRSYRSAVPALFPRL